jgi:hypothetical protein
MSRAPEKSLQGRVGRAAAWSAGLAGFYWILLGSLTLDSLDKEFPRREESCPAPREDLVLPIELRDLAAADPDIRVALSCLPPAHLLRARDFGARFVVTKTELTEIFPGLADNEGLGVGGVYDRENRTLYVKQDGGADRTALHEFGHLFDHVLGDRSSSSEFLSAFSAAKNAGTLGAHYASAPQEFFAESYARYYFSDRSRRRLRDDYPDAGRFFDALDARK